MNHDIPRNALFRHYERNERALEKLQCELHRVADGLARIVTLQQRQSGRPVISDVNLMSVFYVIAAIEDRLLDARSPSQETGQLVNALESMLAEFEHPPCTSLEALSADDAASRVAACASLYSFLLFDQEQLKQAALDERRRTCLRALNRLEETLASRRAYSPLKDIDHINTELAKRRCEHRWLAEAKGAFAALGLKDRLEPLLNELSDAEAADFKIRLGESIKLRLDVLNGTGDVANDTRPSSLAPASPASVKLTKERAAP